MSPVTTVISEETKAVIGDVSFEFFNLPGHSINQMGVRVNGDVLFAADAYFGTTVIEKHVVPFLVDYEQTLESAKRVLTITAKMVVPGHGTPTENPEADVHFLMTRHQEVCTQVLNQIRTDSQGFGIDALLSFLSVRYEVPINTIPSYALFRTSLSAYLTYLIEQEEIEAVVVSGNLVFRSR